MLQEHTKQGEVVLLVYRGGRYARYPNPDSLMTVTVNNTSANLSMSGSGCRMSSSHQPMIVS